jgi:predicted dehydrogenase
VKPLKVGVIGVGHLGKEHARIYEDMRDAELVGVVDADPTVARSIAKKCRTEWSEDPAFLLDRAEAVSVVVPTVHHAEVALPFLERGIAVLVEKPMTFRVEEAESLVAAAAKSGAKLQVGHVERFNPGFRAIAAQNMKPLFIECHRLSPFRFRSADIGVVFDLMIHDLDIVHCLVGAEVLRVEAVGVPVISGHEDIANARITFEGGCVANLTASRVSLKSMRRIRFFAPDCYVTIDTMDKTATVYRKKPDFNEVAKGLRNASDARVLFEMRKLAYGDLVEVQTLRLGEEEPLRAELGSFVNCVREGHPPVVPGEDGVRAVRLAQTILSSLRLTLAEAGTPFEGTDA